MKEYLEKGAHPLGATENDKRMLRRLAAGFFLSGAILYKRSVDLTLQCCMVDREAKEIMKEVHERAFGTHANGHALARKILRADYYWTQMESDCCQYVKRCMKCQIYADNIHVAPSILHNLATPWPFSMWGLDMIGPIEPKASNRHRFILVAIDYFTKWVEAASYASVTRSVVVKFIKRDIICRYGLVAHIIMDNGTNLNNKMMTELCEQFKIKHHNSTPYYPKMKGAIEPTNKNIKKIVQNMVVTFKDWHDMLPYALHGYCTLIRTSTGETPYSLVYDIEAVLLVEVKIPSLRVLVEVELSDAEWVQTELDQLNLIEEKQLYQKRIKSAFDKKVRPRAFKEGDLVLKKILPNTRDQRGKWAPNYEGPYVVKHAFCGGALMQVDSEGQELKYPINADVVKVVLLVKALPGKNLKG
ncbi:Gypsy retrotransposon integrase-like protein 1, partial [Mucuna pruriens]